MSNQTAVITGATSGIGAAYAWEYARRGYDLVITGRRQEVIGTLAEDLRESCHVQVDVVLAELSSSAGVQKVISAITDRNVDVLINNAGFGANALFQHSDLSVMAQLAKVNVLAPMALIHAVLPGMVLRGRGTVINISSEAVYMAVPKNTTYAASKAFLKTFTEGLHLDLFGTGVKVMAVCPGLTHTDLHEKMGMAKARQTNHGFVKWMSPEDIVRISLRELDKGKVVSIPGLHTKMIIRLLGFLPRKNYYKLMLSFSRKAFKKKQTEDWENPTRLFKFIDTVGNNLLLNGIYTSYINTLGLKGDENVLEFGSGSGAGSRHLAKKCGHLTCVDTSKYWTAVAQKRLRRFPHVRFYTDAVTSLHLDAASFDAVFIHYTLHDVEESLRSDIVAELFRLLKPGGCLFIKEPQRTRDGMPVQQIRDLMSSAGFTEASASQHRQTFSGVYNKA